LSASIKGQGGFPAGFLLDEVEHRLSKGADQLLRIDRPDAADHAGAEILLDTVDRGWRGGLEERSSELEAVRAIVDPGPVRLNKLAREIIATWPMTVMRSRWPRALTPQDAEAVLGVVQRDAVDQAGQDLGWRARFGWRHHHPKMNRKISTC
jgi:hypothetical protein